MKTKAIEFNAEDLVSSVEAMAGHLSGKGKITLRTKTVSLPPRVKPMNPAQVRATRKKLNLSQPILPPR